MPTEVKFDYWAIREMLNSPEMVAEMGRRADNIRAFAESIAPVGKPWEDDRHIGRYKASFHSEARPFGGVKPPHARAEGRVWNDAPEAPEVEFGVASRGQEGEHVLLRAARATRGGE